MDEEEMEQVFLGLIVFSPASHNSTVAPRPSITAPRGVRYPRPCNTLPYPRAQVKGLISDLVRGGSVTLNIGKFLVGTTFQKGMKASYSTTETLFSPNYAMVHQACLDPLEQIKNTSTPSSEDFHCRNGIEGEHGLQWSFTQGREKIEWGFQWLSTRENEILRDLICRPV
jgi:hypothetical protein